MTTPKEKVYSSLEGEMLTYQELISVPVSPSGEKMVPIIETANLLVSPIDPDMHEYTGNKIYVRESVAKMLGLASLSLAEEDPSMQLQVVYGYRSLNIQRSLFEKVRKELAVNYVNEADLLEVAHRQIAVPDVAGHPTGGAVDIQLTKRGKPLSQGTKIWEFVPDTYTFSPFIDSKGRENRQLLRRVMVGAGFAPFDGEWWHFSYGDREWAKYYNRPPAVYEQIEFSTNT
jgi:D-alanyl-D-alanine dipeptidase